MAPVTYYEWLLYLKFELDWEASIFPGDPSEDHKRDLNLPSAYHFSSRSLFWVPAWGLPTSLRGVGKLLHSSRKWLPPLFETLPTSVSPHARGPACLDRVTTSEHTMSMSSTQQKSHILSRFSPGSLRELCAFLWDYRAQFPRGRAQNPEDSEASWTVGR